MSPLEAKIADIMVAKLVTVPYSASVMDVCELFIQHRFLSLPVVDDERRLMGVADVSLFTDVFDVAERQRGEDVYQLIGVHLSSHRTVNPLQSFAQRFPWLMCNIAGGVLCAVLSSFYESYLVHVVLLALFIPVVLALSESVSIQAMTIALEALHGDQLDVRFVLRTLVREFAAALLLGVACGGTVGLIAWLWKGQPWVAGAIGGSIALAMITACMLGVALPALVRTFRIDPRIAAGPIVLATADVATLLFYFNLAGWLLGL
jgi:magnesium transporter